jgi:hypothetical protein
MSGRNEAKNRGSSNRVAGDLVHNPQTRPVDHGNLKARVLKYAVGTEHEIRSVGTPKILCVGIDRNGGHYFWAEVTEGEGSSVHTISTIVVGTGHQVPDGFEYVSTIFDMPYVWHVYRRV